MGTNFDKMSHEGIYDVIQDGVPTKVDGAANQLGGLNKTITNHLDRLDQLATSMAAAWPDENGQNFRSTLGHTITYLRELQANHVVSASSSVTQVMSASHEKLSHIQSTIPPPPAVSAADQQKVLNKQSVQHDGAQTPGMAAEGRSIAAAKADDAKAVALAKSLANTYLVEKAKLTAPPAAPTVPGHNGAGTSAPMSNSGGASSNHAMSNYTSSGGNDGSSATFVSSGSTSGIGSSGNGHSATFQPVHSSSGNNVDYGSDGGSLGAGGGGAGQGGANHGTLLDPNGHGPLYDANGNLIGGTGFDASSAGFTGSGAAVNGVLGGAGSAGGGFGGAGSAGGGFGGGGSGFDAGALGAVGGGLVGAGVIAARKQAAQRAQRAALLKQELTEEELAANGTGGTGGLSSSQLAAMNAQRNGILSAGEQAGLMNGERTMLATQQRTLIGANAAMTAEEEAQLSANQRMVPGQLGGSAVTSAAPGARTGMPFAGGGVVGGAERVTWLVEDRDLFSADPGVRAIIEE